MTDFDTWWSVVDVCLTDNLMFLQTQEYISMQGVKFLLTIAYFFILSFIQIKQKKIDLHLFTYICQWIQLYICKIYANIAYMYLLVYFLMVTDK